MDDAGFANYLSGRNLAQTTKQQRSYALKRVEKAEGLDLDDEYDRDGLTSLLARYRYGAADANIGRPNPTKLDIDLDKLRTHLTWYRSHISDYRSFKASGGDLPFVEPSADSGEDPAFVEAVQDSVGRTFALERDMQIALRAHIEQLEPGLTAIDDGKEQKVEAGFIDILAKDADGVLTVIELKADVSRTPAIAQILGYMGCIAADRGGAVRGILVASDHDQKVRLAARAVPNLQLRTYSYQFHFE
jgi:hypothetical protein